MPYRAFISYSHEADGEFADELHDAMEKLAKPWTKRRARRVALDKTAMSAGSSLSDTIEEKLADSEWLVLLAAPQSAHCASVPAGEGAPEDAEVWTFEFTGVVVATDE